MQMVLAKERINLFMKGADTDLDEVYKKFGVDYNLQAQLLSREADADGRMPDSLGGSSKLPKRFLQYWHSKNVQFSNEDCTFRM